MYFEELCKSETRKHALVILASFLSLWKDFSTKKTFNEFS